MTNSEPSQPESDRFPWVTRRPAPDRLSRELVDRFGRLSDLSSTVSDVLDELGLVGVVAASQLRPTLPDDRVIGPAITVRNVEQRRSAFAAVADRDWRMAEVVAIADAQAGDVLLIEGVPATSNMGGLMATLAKRQGVAGAVVDGGVRDVAQSRSLQFPIWSADISPVTGKWRCVTEEINGTVTIAGVTVAAGDLVIADETGICFVPQARVVEVLTRCEEIAAKETRVDEALASGASADDMIRMLYRSLKQDPAN